MNKEIIRKLEEEHLERLNTLLVVLDSFQAFVDEQDEDNEIYEKFLEHLVARVHEEMEEISSIDD